MCRVETSQFFPINQGWTLKLWSLLSTHYYINYLPSASLIFDILKTYSSVQCTKSVFLKN